MSDRPAQGERRSWIRIAVCGLLVALGASVLWLLPEASAPLGSDSEPSGFYHFLSTAEPAQRPHHVSLTQDVAPSARGDRLKVFPPGETAWDDPAEYTLQRYQSYVGDGDQTQEWMKALQVQTGHVVADIGAGSGQHAWPLSGAVGPDGVVLAIDINPIAIEFMRSRLREVPLPYDNLEIIHSHPWNVGLSATPFQGEVDRALMAEAHFFKQFPRAQATYSCLRSLFLAMRPGALLLVKERRTTSLEETLEPLLRTGFVVVEPSAIQPEESGDSYLVLLRRP